MRLKVNPKIPSIDKYSKNGNKWNLRERKNSPGWVGVRFPVHNFSLGYQGLTVQWWRKYIPKNAKVLMTSEENKIKDQIHEKFPKWDITTTDMYVNLHELVRKKLNKSDTDIEADICEQGSIPGKYDAVTSQAMLEHIYDPFGAMKNMASVLKKDGILQTHTAGVQQAYHRAPVDCFRFMRDWWTELQKHLDLELLEYIGYKNHQIFALYRKTK